MDDHPYSCLDSDDITHVVREFIRLNVSSLPVVNGDGRLVGFVSDGDVLKSIATYESRTVPTGLQGAGALRQEGDGHRHA